MRRGRVSQKVSCRNKQSLLLHCWTFCIKFYNFLCRFFNGNSIKDEYGEGKRVGWSGGSVLESKLVSRSIIDCLLY